jgi:hypothetical protein
VQGSAVGLKLAAESWLDLSPMWFLSVDANIEAWRGRAIALGQASRWGARQRGIRRRPWRRLPQGNLSAVELSGGFTGNYLEDEPSGYVSLGVYRAF